MYVWFGVVLQLSSFSFTMQEGVPDIQSLIATFNVPVLTRLLAHPNPIAAGAAAAGLAQLAASDDECKEAIFDACAIPELVRSAVARGLALCCSFTF